MIANPIDVLDFVILEEYERPLPARHTHGCRNQRIAARLGVYLGQVHVLLFKYKAAKWIAYSAAARAGELTEAGKVRLSEVRKNLGYA